MTIYITRYKLLNAAGKLGTSSLFTMVFAVDTSGVCCFVMLSYNKFYVFLQT